MSEMYNIGNVPDLQPVSVGLDEFVRPRESEAGKQTMELAQTLAGIRPELNNFLQPVVEQEDANESAQGQRWALKNASISAGDFATATAGWSVPRILSASQSLAQHSAEDYSLEVNSALDTLAKSGKPASPADVDATIQPIRDRYLQQGQGYGTLWTKTFGEYAERYEAGAVHNYQTRALDELSQQAVSNATADVATESTALLTQPGDYQVNFTKWLAGYFDPSHLHSPLSPTQKNTAIIGGFQGAVVHALSNQKFDIADHLIDGFKNIEVFPGAKLSETAMGASTLQDLLRQSHYARVSANETDALARQQKEADARQDLWGFMKSQRDLPASQQSFLVPDNIMDKWVAAGLPPETAQAQHEYFLKAPQRNAKEESQEDVDAITSKAVDAMTSYRQNPDDGKAFNNMMQTLSDLRQSPEAQGPRAKLFLDSRQEMANELAKEHDNPLLQESSRLFSNGVRGEVSALEHSLSDLKVSTNADTLTRLQGKLSKLGVNLDTSNPNDVHWSVPQLESDANDAYLSAQHSIKGNGWQDADSLTTMRNGVLSKFRGQIQNLIGPAKAAVDSANTAPPDNSSTSSAPLVGPDGIPNQSLVSQVLNTRSTQDDTKFSFGNYSIASVLGGPIGSLAYGASHILPAATRNSVFNPQGRVVAQMTAEGIPPEVIRGGPSDLAKTWPFASANVADFQNQWKTTTDNLTQFEKNNADLLKRAAANPLSSFSTGESQSLSDWAKMREGWTHMVNVRGLDMNELAKTPTSWLTREGIPFPTVPIGSDLNDSDLKTIQKQFGLSDDQTKLFVATQLKLKDIQDKDAQRRAAYKPLTPAESAVYGDNALLQSADPF